MKYAVVSLAGKQRRLVEGKTYKADHFDEPITEVLLYVDGDSVTVGQPLVRGVGVKLSQVEHLRDRKVEIRRYEAKSRSRRTRGHRQPITRFMVEKIGKGVKSSIKFKK